MSASKSPVCGTQHRVGEPPPEQITLDALIDHTLLQSEGHRPRWGGQGQHHQAIARIEAQARIKRYFVKLSPC